MKRKNSIIGMTILELVTVITIIALLGLLGYPSYRNYKLTANRSDAQVSLMKAYSKIQRFLAASNIASLQNSDLEALNLPTTSIDGYYTLSVDISSPNYTIIATAIEEQLKDTDCKQIIIDNYGNKSSKNSSNNTSTGCW